MGTGNMPIAYFPVVYGATSMADVIQRYAQNSNPTCITIAQESEIPLRREMQDIIFTVNRDTDDIYRHFCQLAKAAHTKGYIVQHLILP